MREEIQNRQNEERMLKIQYSARGYYNKAQLFGNLAWLCCLFSAATLIIPETVPLAYQLTVPIVVDFLALLLSKMQEDSVEKAAFFREYFDAYVLGINDSYKQREREEIIGDAIEYCEKHPKESRVQIANTGFDNPPGVKDWYDLKDDGKHHSNDEVVFECQKQNAWWEERLSESRIKVFAAIGGILFVTLVAIIIIDQNHILIRAVLSSALIVKSIERIIAEKKFVTISHKIDGAISVMRENPNTSNIEELQKLINTKRKCNVVGINILHKRKANRLSNTYHSRKEL